MIRKATPKDAVQAALLIADAWGDLALAVTGADDRTEAQHILAGLFAASGSRISQENAVVDERDGKIVGVLIAYHGREEALLVQPMTEALRARTNNPAAVVEMEAAPDEYYLDTVSVRADWRGQGVGTALLHAFEERAQILDHRKLALLVDEDNHAARRLYESQGYHAEGAVTLAGHAVTHMIKVLRAL